MEVKKVEGIEVIEKGSKEFPIQLYDLKEIPNQIYILGNKKLLYNFSVAIIGSRRCEEESAKIAKETSYNLAKNRIQVISGMALGIDTIAHKGCLEAKGKTIAVLRQWI